MADITEYISGSIIGKLDILSGRTPAANVIVYVEGEDDVPVWEQILSNYPKYKFRVSVNRSYQVNGNYPNGKTALMHINGLSKEKIVCVDADLDLAVKNYSPNSMRLRKDPFVFNTQYYAIENVLSQPELLKEVVATVTGEETFFDFDLFMKRMSNTICDIFRLYLSCIKQKRSMKFSLEDFKEEVNKMKFTATMSEADFNIQKANCLARMKAQFLLHRNSMIQYRKRLKSLGYKERDTYKLMQGHCLYNSIVKNLLFSICKAIFEKRLSALVKNTPAPDHAALKKEVYAVTAMHGSLREYINEVFYNNTALRNHVPTALQQKLTDSYS